MSESTEKLNARKSIESGFGEPFVSSSLFNYIALVDSRLTALEQRQACRHEFAFNSEVGVTCCKHCSTPWVYRLHGAIDGNPDDRDARIRNEALEEAAAIVMEFKDTAINDCEYEAALRLRNAKDAIRALKST